LLTRHLRRAGRLIRVKPAPRAAAQTARMAQPQVFLAYTPRGAGLRCALAYLSDSRDVYGWFAGRNDLGAVGLYFVAEDFYSPKARPRYAAALTLDLHTGWILDEKRCHELAALQEAFVAEWLFYRHEVGAVTEIAVYHHAELATDELNVRYDKLGKFSKLQPTWTYYSQGFERPVLDYLAKRWPLEYRPEREP